MIACDEKDGRVMITVHAVPRASRSEIVGEHNGALRVRLAAAPVEGAANEELVRLIAKAFGVSQNYVEITAGRLEDQAGAYQRVQLQCDRPRVETNRSQKRAIKEVHWFSSQNSESNR
jgi:uncharacterized protein (TIGR00251 family)